MIPTEVVVQTVEGYVKVLQAYYIRKMEFCTTAIQLDKVRKEYIQEFNELNKLLFKKD